LPGRSGGEVEGLLTRGNRRAEVGVRLAAAGDQDLLTGGGALHVVAEVVAELVGANDIRWPAVNESGASRTTFEP